LIGFFLEKRNVPSKRERGKVFLEDILSTKK
jgi:hypothetical protein